MSGPPRGQTAQRRGPMVGIPCRRGADGKVPDEVADADMIVLQGPGGNGDAFEAMRRVRFVFRPYVGYDDIDVDAANEYQMLVANVPDTFVIEVADHAMALI